MATGIMLAGKIASIVDDDGSGTTGTVLDKAWMQALDQGSIVDTPGAMVFRMNGTNSAVINNGGDATKTLTGVAIDNGTGAGCGVVLPRNSNGSTPAAAYLALMDKGGTYYFLYVDDSGILRIHTSAPTNATDTTGTVVGSQT